MNLDTTIVKHNNTVEKGDSRVVAFLLDGGNGSVLQRTLVYHGEYFLHKADNKGNRLEYDTDGQPFTKMVPYRDQLILYGTFHEMTNTVRKSVLVSQVDKSEWRLAMITPSGSVSTMNYSGKGVDRYTTHHSTRVNSDAAGNELQHVDIGSQGQIFLYGTVAKGTSRESVGKFHVEELLARMDPGSKKLVWKFSNPQPTQAYTTEMFYRSVQKFIRGVIVNTCDSTLQMIDVNGKLSATPLKFHECTGMPAFDDVRPFQGPSFEPGIIYLWTSNGLAKVDLSGILAKADFRSPAGGIDIPSMTVLQPNHPNPFNPITTISFDLATDAFVTMTVYNLLGQEVATLANHEFMTAGEGQELVFDGSGLSTGVYLYRLTTQGVDENGTVQGSGSTMVRKMMLIK
jgi:hypothetical protein